MTEQVLTESWVAKKLGVSRDRLREMRAELELGVDWTRERQAVVYTAVGLEKIEARVRYLLEEARADGPVGATAEQLAELENAAAVVLAPVVEERPRWATPPETVWRPFTPDPVVEVRVLKQARNPRVLYGELLDRTPVAIAVQVSPLWRPGMVLPCVKLDEGRYEYRGRKPRSWGRWV